MDNGVNTSAAFLEITGLSKDFEGFIAIENLNLTLERGELRCIIGPNGAGKTTLFNLIAGHINPSSGKIYFCGRDITGNSISSIARSGILRKYQTPTVFQALSVYENLDIAIRGRSRTVDLVFPASSDTRVQQIEELLALARLAEKRYANAGELSHGEKQWLEIAMVISQKPQLILFDEPTAGMTPKETKETARLLKDISKTTSMIVIEHDLQFVRGIAQKVTVLHRGSVLAEGDISSISQNETVRRIYLGREQL